MRPPADAVGAGVDAGQRTHQETPRSFAGDLTTATPSRERSGEETGEGNQDQKNAPSRWRPRPAFRLTSAEAIATRRAINLRRSVLSASATLGTTRSPVKKHPYESRCNLRRSWPAPARYASKGTSPHRRRRLCPRSAEHHRRARRRERAAPLRSRQHRQARSKPGANLYTITLTVRPAAVDALRPVSPVVSRHLGRTASIGATLLPWRPRRPRS